jgi:predicted small secreted protein
MKKIIYCTLVLLTCIFLTSCKNQASEIGLDLIDDLLGTDFTDTITLQAYSIFEDTINTTNMSANILGHISDPVFGNSDAGIYTQISLAGAAVNFGNHPIIDSVVLTLQIQGYYGDTNSAVGIRVHQLSEDLSSEETYYQNSSLTYDPTPLNYSLSGYTLKPNTSVVVDTGVYSAHLRVRLKQSFGQDLLDHQDDLNNNMQNYLKGLYIGAVSHTGNCGYMLISNLTSALSGIVLYYHNDSVQNMRYTLSCNDNCVRFTQINHQYTASNNNDFLQEVCQNQHDLGSKVLFVQGGGGVKTRITFPYLEHAFDNIDKRVVIHRAELVITNVDANEAFLIPPTNLSLQGIGKSDSSLRFLPDDDYYTSTSYFGGIYDSKTHEYRFRITRYVQQLILEQNDWSNSMYLIVRGSAVRPHRLVFDGTDIASPTRLRLEIAYSTY